MHLYKKASLSIQKERVWPPPGVCGDKVWRFEKTQLTFLGSKKGVNE
jgi:hypothetical protein